MIKIQAKFHSTWLDPWKKPEKGHDQYLDQAHGLTQIWVTQSESANWEEPTNLD